MATFLTFPKIMFYVWFGAQLGKGEQIGEWKSMISIALGASLGIGVTWYVYKAVKKETEDIESGFDNANNGGDHPSIINNNNNTNAGSLQRNESFHDTPGNSLARQASTDCDTIPLFDSTESKNKQFIPHDSFTGTMSNDAPPNPRHFVSSDRQQSYSLYGSNNQSSASMKESRSQDRLGTHSVSRQSLSAESLYDV